VGEEVWLVGNIDMALSSGLRSFYSGHKPVKTERKTTATTVPFDTSLPEIFFDGV